MEVPKENETQKRNNLIKYIFITTTLVFFITTIVFLSLYIHEEKKDKIKDLYNDIQITDEWDKTFTKSDKVNHKKVTFHNRFGITLVGDLYEPIEKGSGKLAAIDPRIKVTIVSTMYDMSRVTAFGYGDDITEAERYETRKTLGDQRITDYKNGYYATQGGNPEERPTGALFLQQYWDYYKTDRGYHKRSLNSNQGWITTAQLSLLNTKILAFTNEIQNAVLMIHGELAHSLYMGETAYQKLETANKEFMQISNAYHVDLYDNVDVIPFDYMAEFINKNI